MLSINLRVVNLPRSIRSISAVWIFLQITATGEVGGCKIRSLQFKTALYPQIFCTARYCIANQISRNITARREKLFRKRLARSVGQTGFSFLVII